MCRSLCGRVGTPILLNLHFVCTGAINPGLPKEANGHHTAFLNLFKSLNHHVELVRPTRETNPTSTAAPPYSYTSMMYTADSNNASPPNFIIFGEMGVGKSSLINLIAGKNVASASSGAASCTLDSSEYKIRLPDSQCDINLYDTAGLNEPNMNYTNYLDAVAKAHRLIASLQEKGGVHGLLFCIRGGRVSDTVQKNYNLFYKFLCEEKVPLSLVITGLENEPSSMDSWWAHNQAHVEKSGIASVAHVCITTIKGINGAYEQRYLESRKNIHMMLNELTCQVAYSVDGNGWLIRMCKMMREFLVPSKGIMKSRAKMMQVLTKQCKLGREDAAQLIRRIEEKD